MIKFGELTPEQKESFKKEVSKKPKKIYSESEMTTFVEDLDEDELREFNESLKKEEH